MIIIVKPTSVSRFTDLEMLSQKTGKSFDGPTPQIGPAPGEERMTTPASRKQTPARKVSEQRDASEAPSHASSKPRSKSKKQPQEDGIEILGTIDDGDWDT